MKIGSSVVEYEEPEPEVLEGLPVDQVVAQATGRVTA